jgi:hypothetical protein
MDAECPHLNRLPYLEPPKLSQQVHREECTQCFDNQVSISLSQTLREPRRAEDAYIRSPYLDTPFLMFAAPRSPAC